jgi:hypothetical protein
MGARALDYYYKIWHPLTSSLLLPRVSALAGEWTRLSKFPSADRCFILKSACVLIQGNIKTITERGGGGGGGGVDGHERERERERERE